LRRQRCPQQQHSEIASFRYESVGNWVGGTVVASCIALLLVLPMLSLPATADGYSMRYDTALDAWESLTERDQFCIINYDGGIEKMIVQIEVPRLELSSSEKMAWLIPIPAAPEEVSLRHFQTIPRFDGDSLESAVYDEVSGSRYWYYPFATQIYTAPVLLATYLALGFGGTSGSDAGLVDTYAVVDRYGVTSEVLDADSPEAMSAYLALKGLTLPESAETHLAHYLNSGHSIVLSWISDVGAFISGAMTLSGGNSYSLGIGAEFPCDEIFYPLRMTSVYDTLEIPITVQVLGHVTPEAYPTRWDLRFSCEYRIQDTYAPMSAFDLYGYLPLYAIDKINFTESREEYEYFLDEQISANRGSLSLRDVDYTVVTFDGPAGALSEDLRFSDSSPIAVASIGFVGDNPWVVVLAMTVLASCLSSLLAFAIVIGWKTRFMARVALLGVFNLLSLIGYYMAYVDWLEPRLERGGIEVKGMRPRLIFVFSALFMSQVLEVYLVFFSGLIVGS
jgi:hypothetical protein